MTTNLFVIANVKQLRTGGSFRILLPFFRTSWGVGVLNSAISNSFHNRVEFCTILVGLRGGGGWTPQPPPRYATAKGDRAERLRRFKLTLHVKKATPSLWSTLRKYCTRNLDISLRSFVTIKCNLYSLDSNCMTLRPLHHTSHANHTSCPTPDILHAAPKKADSHLLKI